MSESEAIFRIWVDGDLVVREVANDPTTVLAVATRHKEVTDAADEAGKVWLIEVEIPSEPNPEERFFRFGTDQRGMINPQDFSHLPDHPWSNP